MSKESFDANCEIIMEGYLKKSPPYKPKSIFSLITKRWRKRYFVLFKTFTRPQQLKLYYFKTKPSLNSKNLGSINLESMSALEMDVGYKVNKQNTFSIQTNDAKGHNRIFYLSADSQDVMANWVGKLDECLHLEKRNSKNSSHLQSPSGRLPRTPQIPLSGLKSHPINRSAKSLDFISFSPLTQSINTIIDPSNSYYNLESKLSPMSDDLEEPFCMVDDVYKVPNEIHIQHPYVNLEDDLSTPIGDDFDSTTNQSGSKRFFSNNKSTNQSENKSSEENYFFDNQEYKTPAETDSNHIEHTILNDEANKTNHYFNTNVDDQSDFNFPLPTRIQNDSCSTSTSESSESTSSTSSDEEENENEKLEGIKTPVFINNRPNEDSNYFNHPPLVPNRLVQPSINPTSVSPIPDICSYNNLYAQQDFGLTPIKPSKPNNFDLNQNQNNSKETSLNYIENDCLDLQTDDDVPSSFINSSRYAVHNANNNFNGITSPTLLNSSDFPVMSSSVTFVPPSMSTGDHHQKFSTANSASSISASASVSDKFDNNNTTRTSLIDLSKHHQRNQNNNTNNSSNVEYKEIIISRTEAVHKFIDRLQKK